MWRHEIPVDPSPFASDGPYTHARIAKLDLDFRAQSIQLWIEHGKIGLIESDNPNVKSYEGFIPGEATQSKPLRYPIPREKAAELLAVKDIGKDLDKLFFEYLVDVQGLKGELA